MRKNIVSVALFAVLATLAVGCQKENFSDQNPAVAEMGAKYTVNYTVDGIAQQATLSSDAERDAFFDYLMTLTDEGHEILIQGSGNCGLATKETQTLTTTDKNQANDWAKNKHQQGYNVRMNNNNGEYTVVATKP